MFLNVVSYFLCEMLTERLFHLHNSSYNPNFYVYIWQKFFNINIIILVTVYTYNISGGINHTYLKKIKIWLVAEIHPLRKKNCSLALSLRRKFLL